VTALVTLAGCNSNFGLPEIASDQGAEVARLWRLFFLAALGVGGLVAGLILWSALRYRRRSDELPKQTLFNIPLEVTYTVIPLVIVAILFASTMRATSKVNELAPDPDLVVEVTGFQWQWRFNYPDQGVDIIGATDQPAEMVVPVGSTVRVLLTAADVIHAFYVPEFGVKRDAIPGRETPFDMKVTRAGTFTSGRCAEYCGLNHDKMSFTVRAVPRDEFDSWAAGQTGGRP
jgi:cytochrome c oxidase subunit 2